MSVHQGQTTNRMQKDYRPQTIDSALLDDLSQLVRLAIREDLDRTADLTTLALVPQGGMGSAIIQSRVAGVAAGIDLIEAILQELDAKITWTQHIGDGEVFESKQALATLSGETRDLLTCERTILNFLGRLCGIATLTKEPNLRVSTDYATLLRRPFPFREQHELFDSRSYDVGSPSSYSGTRQGRRRGGVQFRRVVGPESAAGGGGGGSSASPRRRRPIQRR